MQYNLSVYLFLSFLGPQLDIYRCYTCFCGTMSNVDSGFGGENINCLSLKTLDQIFYQKSQLIYLNTFFIYTYFLTFSHVGVSKLTPYCLLVSTNQVLLLRPLSQIPYRWYDLNVGKFLRQISSLIRAWAIIQQNIAGQ